MKYRTSQKRDITDSVRPELLQSVWKIKRFGSSWQPKELMCNLNLLNLVLPTRRRKLSCHYLLKNPRSAPVMRRSERWKGCAFSKEDATAQRNEGGEDPKSREQLSTCHWIQPQYQLSGQEHSHPVEDIKAYRRQNCLGFVEKKKPPLKTCLKFSNNSFGLKLGSSIRGDISTGSETYF